MTIFQVNRISRLQNRKLFLIDCLRGIFLAGCPTKSNEQNVLLLLLAYYYCCHYYYYYYYYY